MKAVVGKPITILIGIIIIIAVIIVVILLATSGQNIIMPLFDYIGKLIGGIGK